jgi:prophage antirepressor-like protein
MNELMRFEGYEVRVETDGDHAWFCAGDVCAVLALDPDALRRLRDDEKGPRLTRTPGGPQQTTWVTEPGLYKLVMRSRKPEAERFQDWVTHDVLPAIRKTGSYSAPETREQLVSRALIAASQALAEKDQQIAILAPKADALDCIADTTGLHGFQEAGKLLQEPPNLWIRWLRQNGHIHDRGRSTVPRQDHIDAGRMVFKSRIVDGKEYGQSYVTPAGLIYFAQRRPGLRCARRVRGPQRTLIGVRP